MEIRDLIKRELISSSLKPRSKKHLLESIAEFIEAKSGIPSRETFETLLKRERLGSTSIGKGVAIPHGKLSMLDETLVCFVRLDEAIGFDSREEEAVDILFVLLAPESEGGDHLKTLATIARFAKSGNALKQIRSAASENAIHEILARDQEDGEAD